MENEYLVNSFTTEVAQISPRTQKHQQLLVEDTAVTLRLGSVSRVTGSSGYSTLARNHLFELLEAGFDAEPAGGRLR